MTLRRPSLLKFSPFSLVWRNRLEASRDLEEAIAAAKPNDERVTVPFFSRLLRRLQLQLALVLFQERPQIICRVQQPNPLLVIQRDRKSPQSIHTHATLFSHAKFQRPFFPRPCLLFQFRNPRQQFFLTLF